MSKTVRKQKQINELGTRDAKCSICGEDEIPALKAVNRGLLEQHHISGGHEGDKIIVCRNCHAKLTDEQLDWPEELIAKNKTPEIRAIAFFRGLSGILELLAKWCMEYAKVLHELGEEKADGL